MTNKSLVTERTLKYRGTETAYASEAIKKELHGNGS
jgi:hypothetical protein